MAERARTVGVMPDFTLGEGGLGFGGLGAVRGLRAVGSVGGECADSGSNVLAGVDLEEKHPPESFSSIVSSRPPSGDAPVSDAGPAKRGVENRPIWEQRGSDPVTSAVWSFAKKGGD